MKRITLIVCLLSSCLGCADKDIDNDTTPTVHSSPEISPTSIRVGMPFKEADARLTAKLGEGGHYLARMSPEENYGDREYIIEDDGSRLIDIAYHPTNEQAKVTRITLHALSGRGRAYDSEFYVAELDLNDVAGSGLFRIPTAVSASLISLDGGTPVSITNANELVSLISTFGNGTVITSNSYLIGRGEYQVVFAIPDGTTVSILIGSSAWQSEKFHGQMKDGWQERFSSIGTSGSDDLSADGQPQPSLEDAIRSEFANLEDSYSRILGEPITLTIVDIHKNEMLDHVSVVFDVSPDKYKPLGNKISTFRKDENGQEQQLQMMMLSAKGGKYVGLFGHQLGLPAEQRRLIEVDRPSTP